MVAPSQAGLDFQEHQAGHQVEVNEAAEDKMAAVRSRQAELLADPSQRDGDLYLGVIGESFVREVDIGEDPAEMILWIWQLRSLMSMSWEDLHSIPVAERISDFERARLFLLDMVIRQANLDTGVQMDAMDASARDANTRARLLGEMDASDLASFAKATGISDRAKALELAHIEGRLAETTDPEERERLERKRASARRRRTG
jgi:hypothetical protein